MTDVTKELYILEAVFWYFMELGRLLIVVTLQINMKSSVVRNVALFRSKQRVGGGCIACASTASSLNLCRADARPPLTHSKRMCALHTHALVAFKVCKNTSLECYIGLPSL